MTALELRHLSHASDQADGGISVAVSALIASQRALGIQADWLTADSFSPLLRDRALRRSVLRSGASLLHLHGLWRSSTRIAHHLAASGLPLVIAPHGMLDPCALAISRHRKQVVWHLWEHRALRSACCLHALCRAEANAIRALLPNTAIAVIPNGVHLPEELPQGQPVWADLIPEDEHVLLFFGRFHHKKGIEPLLAAWELASAAAERHRWWLGLVGYGDAGVLSRRVAEANARGELQRVRVFGPVFGSEKAATLSAASAFILPSMSEGLPMAALEAMAYRLPCLLSSACNLPEAVQTGAAISAEPNVGSLVASLQACFQFSPGMRAAMGSAGRHLVSTHFSWPKVALQTRELYDWVLGRGSLPGFVQLA